jgi:NADPH-dependent 2,4-dienoyl-CoA reductase/sulfur reductase-like enzyme
LLRGAQLLINSGHAKFENPRWPRAIEDGTMDEIVDGLSEVSCDVLVIGGGTAGPMAALKAKARNP